MERKGETEGERERVNREKRERERAVIDMITPAGERLRRRRGPGLSSPSPLTDKSLLNFSPLSVYSTSITSLLRYSSSLTH